MVYTAENKGIHLFTNLSDVAETFLGFFLLLLLLGIVHRQSKGTLTRLINFVSQPSPLKGIGNTCLGVLRVFRPERWSYFAA